MKLLRLPAVIDAVGLKKSSIYSRIALHEFPAPVRLGARAVAWRADELERWIATRPPTARRARIHCNESLSADPQDTTKGVR